MSNKGKIKIQPKKRQPPNRAQPAGPQKRKGTTDNVVKRLQELIQEKDTKIEKLTDRINTLSADNKRLERKIETLQKASASKSKPKAGSSGIDSGMSSAGAASALAAKLGGHVKNKKLAEDKANKGGGGGGVSSGMNQGDAKNALAGLFGAKKSPPKAAPKKSGGGGIDSGMSQAGAAAALGGLFAKKKAPPSGGGGGAAAKPKSGGGGGGADKYKALFKKYEMMMKLGINVHGAVGRMRQDGVDKAAIAAFEKKHGAIDDEDKKVDPASLGLKPKKEVQVSKGIKMKRFHWDPTDLKLVKGSIWESMDESSIRYDKKHFELHFQVRQRKPANEMEEKKGPQHEAGKIITFVSKKRTQAVLIGLKNLNLNNDQLRQVLHNMDEKVMNVDTLSKLLEMAPTMDEQTEAEKKIMQEGTRRVKDYGTVEQFFFTLCDFYNLHQRLKLWMFKQNFHEICDSLQDQYKTIGKACDKLKSNKNLKLLLTIILTFGNHMNAGTRKGKTYGFDLKILTGMTGVKSFDNTRSLLMYIYEFCDRKYPNAIKVLPELTNTLKAASSMEVETLKQAYSRIQDNMKEIKNLITSDEIENYDLDDRFIMVLTKFHKEAQPKMKKFNMTVGNVMVSTKRVMKKFGYGSEEDPKSIESFFQIWWKFIQDFAGAKEKLIALEKERQKRIAKRKKQKEKENKKKMYEKYGKGKSGGLPPGPNDDSPQLHSGGALYKEFEKRQKFDKKKEGLHKKLGGHVKQRSIFIQNGGKLEGQPQNDTMRRLSSMYQNQQDQIKALEEAKKKAAILKYNKGFRLPAINQANKKRWDRTTSFGDQFDIPDDKPMMMPVGNTGRNKNQSKNAKAANGHSAGVKQPPRSNNKPKTNGASSPFTKNKPNYKPSTNGNKNAYSIKPKMNANVVPPPPNGVPPPPQQHGGAANTAAYPMYGSNPQQGWQQQAMGYGSNPNLSYQNAYQQPAPNAYPQYNQQKTRYNNPYRRPQ